MRSLTFVVFALAASAARGFAARCPALERSVVVRVWVPACAGMTVGGAGMTEEGAGVMGGARE